MLSLFFESWTTWLDVDDPHTHTKGEAERRETPSPLPDDRTSPGKGRKRKGWRGPMDL